MWTFNSQASGASCQHHPRQPEFSRQNFCIKTAPICQIDEKQDFLIFAQKSRFMSRIEPLQFTHSPQVFWGIRLDNVCFSRLFHYFLILPRLWSCHLYNQIDNFSDFASQPTKMSVIIIIWQNDILASIVTGTAGLGRAHRRSDVFWGGPERGRGQIWKFGFFIWPTTTQNAKRKKQVITNGHKKSNWKDMEDIDV